jgi:7-carboxy-7-deazaguanine synthase
VSLRVLEIFDSLQGEGHWTGVPMTFVRLAGCNAPSLGLECVRWCDTQDSWARDGGDDLEVQAIVEHVTMPRLCLTGGEPLLQIEGVAELLVATYERDLAVHLETNGTISPLLPPVSFLEFDWVVVSPKPPRYLIAPEWEGLIDELKLVADASLDVATAERLAASHREALVCIQPLAGAGAVAAGDSVHRALDMVMTHPDWRLSLQTHKFLGIK